MDEDVPLIKHSEPPAMGERRARWGYGYQDKVATERILTILKKDLRSGEAAFEGVRLADLQAGRADDFVLVWRKRVEGNSLKWSRDATALNWGELIGTDGLLKELADGWKRLQEQWPERTVSVRLQSNRPPSVERHHAQLISDFSVAEFLRDHWPNGPKAENPQTLKDVWIKIGAHVGLSADDFSRFVTACAFTLAHPEPPATGPDTRDWRHYLSQFDSLHKALAVWITNHPDEYLVDREFLLRSIGFRKYRSSLIQRFPSPQIPYEQNRTAAEWLKHLVDSTSGGYLAVVGPAGVGKSTLVQDVLSTADHPLFVPYYAFLPDGEGNPRDRGEALTFFQDVVSRLEAFFGPRYSLGIADVADGREALRKHMTKANEQYVIHGRKTILLVDGLDHVSGEVDLSNSILRELPDPSEIPEGFLIVLSSQPQALVPGVIGPRVAHAVRGASSRRVEVEGLSREEIHAIVVRTGLVVSTQDRDRLHEACLGNPLILTYLLNRLKNSPGSKVEAVVEHTGRYEGDIDRYYASALSVPLQDGATRRLLGLLCRAAPTIPVAWLQEWPEANEIENLYLGTLAAFVRSEGGHLYFIHPSLIAYLKEETRSRLPGVDVTGQEWSYHSTLADRCGLRSSADPLGRARVFHLLRAGRARELVELLSSEWVRSAMSSFLPYALLRPLILAGLEAAWNLGELGHVVRLILLDYELDQRTTRTAAGDLAKRFLTLDQPDLAGLQLRAAGRLLVDDKVALELAQRLRYYAEENDPHGVREIARRLYLQAKPVALLYQGEPIDTVLHHDVYDTLRAWSEAAPLFEEIPQIADQVRNLTFNPAGRAHEMDPANVKAGLLYAALLTVLEMGDEDSIALLVGEIRVLDRAAWYFAALLQIALRGRNRISPAELESAFGKCPPDNGIALAYADFLRRSGDFEKSKEIVVTLAHVRFETIEKRRSFGFTDVTYTITLRRLQQVLGVPEGPLPGIKDEHEEVLGRIEMAARQLGTLCAESASGNTKADLREAYRSLLLFHNKPVSMKQYDWRQNYVMSWSRKDIYQQLVKAAVAAGQGGVEALRDALLDVMSGPAAEQFSAQHRRLFARALFQHGVLSQQEAVQLGLSSVRDAEEEDPQERQGACFEIATFLHLVGDGEQSREWLTKAGQVSAGARSEKDYHMAHLAEWIDRATIGSLNPDQLRVLEKFARAVQAAGGEGTSTAASRLIKTMLRLDSARAAALAVEVIDRGVLDLSEAVDSLVCGAAGVGVGYKLLSAIYCELLSLISPGATGKTAVAVLRAAPLGARLAAAKELMSSVRTNSVPRQRVGIARDVQDALRKDGLGEHDLSARLPTGADESSLKSRLYRLADGTTRTLDDVAAHLANPHAAEDWNPNPGDNREFDWWSAVEKATVVSREHLERLVATFPPPDYRDAHLLAWQCERLLELGDRTAARQMAEKAIDKARDGSWFQWYDGARKVRAYEALGRIDPQAARAQAREQFGHDLVVGKLAHFLLLDSLIEIFDFLGLEWPADQVIPLLESYLDEVLAANPPVAPFGSLIGSIDESTAEQAICRFLVYLLAFPVVDVGVAARRCLCRYGASGGSALATVLRAKPCWDSVQLEHLLATVHVASLRHADFVRPLHDYLRSLNGHQSVSVRSVARRICDHQGWGWTEIRDLEQPARVLIAPAVETVPTSYDVARSLVGGNSAIAAQLYRHVFELVRRGGADPEMLWFEYARLFDEVERSYLWSNDERLKGWMQRANAKHWLHQRAIVGREAAMRLLGERALSGSVRPGAEQAYDLLYPLYDPALEMIQPSERPPEQTTMNWDLFDQRGKSWLQGEGGADWGHYPHSISGMTIIAERSWFIRPDWEWPREERYRGLVMPVPDAEGLTRETLSSAHELTYDAYLKGLGLGDDQLIVWNAEQQLAGPAYRWIAIASRFAYKFGWHPSDERPFEWLDNRGDTMVRSLYWKDGWIWLTPPRFESLGEGWIVLASPEAVDSIRKTCPGVLTHLWVERHSHGDKPYQEYWHLMTGL
jgi:hypothetical protein